MRSFVDSSKDVEHSEGDHADFDFLEALSVATKRANVGCDGTAVFVSPVSRPVISGGVLGRFAPNVEEEEVSRMMAGIGLSVGLGESLGFAAKLW